MSPNAKRIACWLAAALMFLIVLCSTMAIVQAGSIYEGERAMMNLRFWGTIMLLSLAGTAFFSVYAFRLGRARSGK